MSTKNRSRVISFVLAFIFILAAASSAFAVDETGDGSLSYVPNRVIIKLADNNAKQTFAIQSFSRQTSGTARSGLPDLGIAYTKVSLLNPSANIGDARGLRTHNFASCQNNTFLLYLADTGSRAIEEALEILNANPLVEIAERDYIRQSFIIPQAAAPNDPLFANQISLQHINAPEAWSITTGNRNITIGILDTGIDGRHPDLAPNLWNNPNPNQGGLFNDIHGFDFAGNIGGTPFDAYPGGHGTQVAGIAGARGNNGVGITGVAQNVSLVWMGMRGSEGLSDSVAIRSVNYARNNNIRILTAAWGGPQVSTSLREAIRNFNGLFVVAAGNYSRNNDIHPMYPANLNYPHVITVASSNLNNNNLAAHSNFGVRNVNIAAPGEHIFTTAPGGSYGHSSGTSVATPHVAGVAALMLSVNPHLSPVQLAEIILSTSRHVPGLSVSSGGTLDAYAAVLEAQAAQSSQVVEQAWLPPETTNRFADVPNAPHWQNNPVSWADRNGITTGIRGTAPPEFRPNQPLTRAMFATFIHRVAGEPDVSAMPGLPFADNAAISGINWAESAIRWVAGTGVTTGFRDDNTFRPNNNISREQIATMLFRYAEIFGLDTSFSPAIFNTFDDSGAVSEWAVQAMQWATHHGIITGRAGRLVARDNASRAEAVTMLNRFVDTKF